MILGIAMLLVIMFLPAGLWSLFVAGAGALDMAAILEREGLNKSFGAVTAADDINVRVEQDSVVGLIGSNGAGKTTFINMVTGYLKPDAGTHSLCRAATSRGCMPRSITQLGICRSFQIPQLFDTLTVREQHAGRVGVVACARKHWRIRRERSRRIVRKQRQIEAARAFRSAVTIATSVAGVLPEGVRKLLDIAMAMVVKPQRPAARRAHQRRVAPTRNSCSWTW